MPYLTLPAADASLVMANRYKPFYNWLLLWLGLAVALIGLGALLGYWSDIPWLTTYSVSQTAPHMPYYTALGMICLGFAVKTILDSHPYHQTPQWLWLIRYGSLLGAGGIGIFQLIDHLKKADGHLMTLILSPAQDAHGIAFLSAVCLCLAVIALTVFLVRQCSQLAVAYLVCLPALLIFNMALFALLGHAIHLPVLYNFYMSVPSALGFIICSVAILIGTLPFRGILLPLVSPAPLVRLLTLAAYLSGFAVLFFGLAVVLVTLDYSRRHGVMLTEEMEKWYVLAELGTIFVAMLVSMTALRAVYYYSESSMLQQEELRGRERETVLRSLIQAVHQSLDLEEIFQEIVNVLGTQLQADRCYIARFDEDAQHLSPPTREYKSSSDVPSMVGAEYKIPQESQRSLFGEVCNLNELSVPIFYFDPASPGIGEDTRQYLRDIGVQSGLACPIVYRKQCLAVLFIHQVQSARIWTSDEEELIRTAAGQAAVAISQAELYQQEKANRQQLQDAQQAMKASYRELAEMKNALDASSIVATTDRQGTITYVNDAFCRISRYSREELIGQNHRIINSGYHSHEFFKAMWATIGRGEVWHGEIRNRAKDGSFYWVDTTIVPFMDASGHPWQYVAIRHDITRQKESERRLREFNEILEQRVNERTVWLEATNRELESFCYSVAHDLRTPLRSIEGFSHIILENYRQLLDETGQDYLQRVRTASQQMAQLIHELLNLTRLNRTELQKQAVDLNEMARQILQEFQRNAPERRVSWSVAEHMVAYGDKVMLNTLMDNLLSNAWKFTSGKTDARIEVGFAHLEDGVSLYYVRDNGVGFSQEYIGKLFRPFERLHGPEEFSGSGIGLAVAQRVVHRHGGEICAKGEVGQGAVFYFTLEPTTASLPPSCDWQ